MQVKHSLFASVCPHLIYATLKSTFVVSSLNFATLCVILDTITRTIYLMMRILFSDHVIFLKKEIYCFIILNSVLLVRTLTFLLRSFCLSLYGCALWHLVSKAITGIEVAFNKVLRWIWNLPFNSHTRIVHCTARLFSIFNLISARSSSLLFSALSSSSFPVVFIFRTCSDLAYTTTGYNCFFGNKFKKNYYPEDCYCADIIKNICMTEVNNSDLEHIVNVLSSL